jgi:hypothetical protein
MVCGGRTYFSAMDISNGRALALADALEDALAEESAPTARMAMSPVRPILLRFTISAWYALPL